MASNAVTEGVGRVQAMEEINRDERPVPAGFVLHTESTTSILFASVEDPTGKPQVFLNPVQQYNRDLSIVAIRTWSEQRQKERAAAWEASIRKRRAKGPMKRRAPGGETEEEGGSKRRKVEDGEVEVSARPVVTEAQETDADPNRLLPPVPTFTFTCLEALSATGLRAIRYAKEIPLLRYVIANDLSASAVKDIRRNIEWNGLSPTEPLASTSALPDASATLAAASTATLPTYKSLADKNEAPKRTKFEQEEATLGKVRVNEGDACVVMYNHRTESTRFDCVDLDPYGTAVPFLDAAIGAVADGGLLCVTCTDLGVLAGHNYPEKAFSLYGGVCVNAEYCHEVALRLVLHSIATTAGRYGRYIEPLLSLSIDFYVRIFVRIHTGPKQVKDLASQSSLIYYCHDCQSPYMQPMGRKHTKTNEKTGAVNHSYQLPSGPPQGITERCGECGGKYHIGGPMWNGPIHNPEFVGKMLEHVAENRDDFATSTRIEGMLSVAKAELPTPLYFTPGRICGFFHASSPALNVIASGLLNAGYKVSLSHACAGSIKTDAPRAFIFDVMREWIKVSPVSMKNVKAGSPTMRLLAKAQTAEVDLTLHPNVDEMLMSRVKLVRYQANPEPNWGPGKAAVRGKGGK